MNEFKLLAASWARSFLGAAVATFSIVGFDWNAILASGISALVPVLIRYTNSKDPAFGFKR